MARTSLGFSLFTLHFSLFFSALPTSEVDRGLVGGPVEVGKPGLWRGRAEDFFAAKRPAVGAERDDSVGQLDMADRDLAEPADGDAQRR